MNEQPFKLEDLAPTELMELFPEAKLTLRDRIPTNMLLLYTVLNINKALKEIKYSTEEIREAILGLVAMIPDELRDDDFIKEISKSYVITEVDVRPEYCGVKASVEYCQRKGIPITRQFKQLNYFSMFHACFNLLMRKHILFRIQPKEIWTGKPAVEGDFPELEDHEA